MCFRRTGLRLCNGTSRDAAKGPSPRSTCFIVWRRDPWRAALTYAFRRPLPAPAGRARACPDDRREHQQKTGTSHIPSETTSVQGIVPDCSAYIQHFWKTSLACIISSNSHRQTQGPVQGGDRLRMPDCLPQFVFVVMVVSEYVLEAHVL
jgi:hypothetical protein